MEKVFSFFSFMKIKFLFFSTFILAVFTLSGCDAMRSNDNNADSGVAAPSESVSPSQDVVSPSISPSQTESAENTPKSKLYDILSEEEFQKEVDRAIERYISKQQEDQKQAQEQAQKEAEAMAKNVPPLRSDDHLYGNKNAKIMVFEYSDMQCPFCKKFHTDVKEFIDENQGDVALVFRHFPLTNLHPYAHKLAEGGICISKLAGNDAFWKYADMVFLSEDVRNEEQISEIAVRVGVQEDAFKSCMSDPSIQKEVQKSLEEGSKAGITGTPGNIFYNTETKETKMVSGALPKEALEEVLTSLLK